MPVAPAPAKKEGKRTEAMFSASARPRLGMRLSASTPNDRDVGAKEAGGGALGCLLNSSAEPGPALSLDVLVEEGDGALHREAKAVGEVMVIAGIGVELGDLARLFGLGIQFLGEFDRHFSVGEVVVEL